MRKFIRRLAIGGSFVALTGCSFDVVDSESTPGEEDVREVEQREVMTCPAPYNAQVGSVVYDKELVINNLAVVNDVCRTVWNTADPSCTTPSANSKWTFWFLMTQMAGTNNVSRFVLKWLESFEEKPIVNGQELAARTKIRNFVIDPWRQVSGCVIGKKYDEAGGACSLDPAKAPFRLDAIVNRLDLRTGSYGGPAGEGRFVFNFVNLASNAGDGKPAPLQAAVIFEYKLPTTTWLTSTWGQKWRALGGFSLFDASYRNALQAITDKFSLAGTMPGAANNGSPISQVRTNDLIFDPNGSKVWSLREFKLGCLPGQACGANDKFLIPTTVAQTPANSKNNTADLQNYINANATSILNGSHSVPLTFNGTSFLGAESTSGPLFVGPFKWMTPAYNPAVDADKRRLFAISTCNGCHYAETETNNMHIFPRNHSMPANLSPFLSSPVTITSDPSGNMYDYDEPLRRKCELLHAAAGNDIPLTTSTGRPH